MDHNHWVGLAVLIGVVWCIPSVIVAMQRVRSATRRMVFQNLDSAREGGQFEPGGYLHGENAQQIAYDMTLYAADLAGYDETKLEPHVRDWLRMWGLA